MITKTNGDKCAVFFENRGTPFDTPFYEILFICYSEHTENISHNNTTSMKIFPILLMGVLLQSVLRI